MIVAVVAVGLLAGAGAFFVVSRGESTTNETEGARRAATTTTATSTVTSTTVLTTTSTTTTTAAPRVTVDRDNITTATVRAANGAAYADIIAGEPSAAIGDAFIKSLYRGNTRLGLVELGYNANSGFYDVEWADLDIIHACRRAYDEGMIPRDTLADLHCPASAIP